MKGFKSIFKFTFRHQIIAKTYKITTIVIATALFLIPVLVMVGIEIFGNNGDDSIVPNTIYYYADVFGGDYSFLESDAGYYASSVVPGSMDGTGWVQVDSLEDGKARLGSGNVLIYIKEDETQFTITGIVPDDREDLKNAAGQICDDLQYSMTSIAARAYGLSDETLGKVFDMLSEDNEEAATTPEQILIYVFTYANILLIYLMVIFYGNGVAQNVLLEKSSKLMDLFLTSVKPRAIIFGKVLASCLAALIQMLIFIVALVLGFLAGDVIVQMINPFMDTELETFMKTIDTASGFLAAPGVIIAILMIVAGFIMYCLIASVGGAMASKREDLGQTNSVFTLIIVASYIIILLGGFMGSASATREFGIFDVIPFTSMMVTPARIITGVLSPAEGCVSLLIIVLSGTLFMLLSGRIYKAMSLYKGSVPKLGKVLTIMKAENKG